ncbi:MAG: hypothetical protein K8Q91_01170 [Candidatus Vogelbacteria bacterium]|nr:hypothetical protein [Candidatus Vogelbacteria bacterium]
MKTIGRELLGACNTARIEAELAIQKERTTLVTSLADQLFEMIKKKLMEMAMAGQSELELFINSDVPERFFDGEVLRVTEGRCRQEDIFLTHRRCGTQGCLAEKLCVSVAAEQPKAKWSCDHCVDLGKRRGEQRSVPVHEPTRVFGVPPGPWWPYR